MPDYSFYTNTYHGSLIPEADFPYLIGKADARLGELTFDRHTDPALPASVQVRVSLALCAVADVLCAYESSSGSPVGAAAVDEERVGTHTVKYRGAVSVSQALSAQIRSLASAYLLTTGLLNRACRISD